MERWVRRKDMVGNPSDKVRYEVVYDECDPHYGGQKTTNTQGFYRYHSNAWQRAHDMWKPSNNARVVSKLVTQQEYDECPFED